MDSSSRSGLSSAGRDRRPGECAEIGRDATLALTASAVRWSRVVRSQWEVGGIVATAAFSGGEVGGRRSASLAFEDAGAWDRIALDDDLDLGPVLGFGDDL